MFEKEIKEREEAMNCRTCPTMYRHQLTAYEDAQKQVDLRIKKLKEELTNYPDEKDGSNNLCKHIVLTIVNEVFVLESKKRLCLCGDITVNKDGVCDTCSHLEKTK